MTDHHGEEIFLAYLIGQQLRHNEYEGKVNALIAAGHPMNEARTIVKAWHALNHCPRWYPLIWQGAATLCGFGVLTSLPRGLYAGGLIYAVVGGACLLRARYCSQANARAQASATRARSTLARYGQL